MESNSIDFSFTFMSEWIFKFFFTKWCTLTSKITNINTNAIRFLNIHLTLYFTGEFEYQRQKSYLSPWQGSSRLCWLLEEIGCTSNLANFTAPHYSVLKTSIKTISLHPFHRVASQSRSYSAKQELPHLSLNCFQIGWFGYFSPDPIDVLQTTDTSRTFASFVNGLTEIICNAV